MSAIPGLNPSPTIVPGPRLAPASPGRPWRFRLLLLAALVSAGGWALYQLKARPRAQNGPARAAVVRTVRVTSGSIQKVLRLTGSTTAKDYVSIAAPRMRAAEGGRNLLLMYLPPSGSVVKKGDLVAQIDTQAMKDHLDDLDAQIAQSQADIKRRKAEIAEGERHGRSASTRDHAREDRPRAREVQERYRQVHHPGADDGAGRHANDHSRDGDGAGAAGRPGFPGTAVHEDRRRQRHAGA